MQKLQTRVTGIDQGTVELFAEFDTGGDMWTGSGDRKRAVEVRFSEPYRSIPVVHASVTLFDVKSGANHRFQLLVEDVTAEGFWLVGKTWGDTQLARCSASWMAIGALQDDLDWEI